MYGSQQYPLNLYLGYSRFYLMEKGKFWQFPTALIRKAEIRYKDISFSPDQRKVYGVA